MKGAKALLVTLGVAIPRRPVLLGLSLLAILAVGAAPASAEQVHVLTGSFSKPAATPLNRPYGVAVDNSSGPSAGDVYVTDTRNERVVKFAPNGEFLVMWGSEVNEGTGAPGICTNAGPPTNICKESAQYSNAPGGFSNAFTIAVDPSSGPSAGDIYVSNIGENVQKFEPNGHLVTGWGGSPFPGAMNGFGGYWNVAVDSAGDLGVLGETSLSLFDQSGASLGSIESPTSASNGVALDSSGGYFQINGSNGAIERVSSSGADLGTVNANPDRTRGLAYDPVHEDLYAVAGTYFTGYRVSRYHFNGSGEVVEPGSSTCALSESGCEPTEIFGGEGELIGTGEGPLGVAVNTVNQTVYVVNADANNILVYSSLDLPQATTGPVSNLERDSVQFNGSEDPVGAGEITSCEFEYGTTTAYGSSAECVPATSASATAVTAQLAAGSLASGTTYHYRLVAGNAEGRRAGKDLTFATPPAVADVTTEEAEDVGRLGATFEGSYSGDGLDTSYYFEYGPTTAYGEKTAVVDGGTASGAQSVGIPVTGLNAYAPYHFRLVAQNQYGKAAGADETLHTLAPLLPAVERSYVSTVQPTSVTVNADLDPGEGLTSYRFEYGPTESYGTRTLVGGPINPESADHTASTEISGLQPGQTYHFRVLATNFTGTTEGADQTFTTPSAPVVASASAGSISQTSAALTALVNPSLGLTTYRFEYGTSTGYGSSTPVAGPIGPDNAIHSVGAPLSGLAPGTVYHFRVVATNEFGATDGVDQSFTTSPQPSTVNPGGKACKKGFVKKHGKCVRKPKPKHKKRHHKKKGHGHG